MKGKKIMATLVVLAMMLSMVVVFEKITNIKVISEASAVTPGLDTWEGEGNNGTNVISTNFDKIYYKSEDNDGYLNVNSAFPWDNVTYYLYYPVYKGDRYAQADYDLYWLQYRGKVGTTGAIPNIEPTTDYRFGDTGNEEKVVEFNASGLWVISNASEATFTGSFRTQEALWASSIAAWFWVNTSEYYTTSITDDVFEYGELGTIDVEIDYKEGENIGEPIDEGARVAIYNATGILPGQGTYDPWAANKLSSGGALSGIEKNTSFTNAGTWNVETYYDHTDESPGDQIEYLEGPYARRYYNRTSYGSTSTYIETYATTYNYSLAGPWDPPEYNATRDYITVKAGEPTIKLTNVSKVYWGFGLRIDVNVTDASGMGITLGNVTIKKRGSSTTYYHDQSYEDLYINESSALDGNYSIEIARYDETTCMGWDNISSGTWYVFFSRDFNGDNSEEWNNSESFSVSTSTPPVRMNLLDDDDEDTGSATDYKVNTKALTTADNNNGYRDIQFQILGTSVADAQGRAYYGDNTTWEDRHNISVTGDILYPVNDSTLTYTAGSDGIWTARVYPTKYLGTITIRIDWPGTNNGSESMTIDIINGSSVSVDVSTFEYGDEFDLTVTVLDKFGDLDKYANVYLFWHGTNMRLNQTTPGTGAPGKGQGGEFTYKILLTDQQGQTAPENITIAARSSGGHWGYAKVNMQRRHNIVVNVTPTTNIYAGEFTEYDIDILVNGAKPTIYDDITVDLYNSGGTLITADWWTDVQDDISTEYNIDDLEIFFDGGIWTLYAYNDTHDSKGNNGTVEVTRYSVGTTPSTLAWLIDTDVNLTFELTPLNTSGDLQVNNITNAPNGSYVGQTHLVEINDGIGTLPDFNATDLGNLTFHYYPTDGENKEANGLVKITTATATPDPDTIYMTYPATVEITITHPAPPYAVIEGVRVDLDYGKADNATQLSRLPVTQTTDASGKVQFSITSEGAGNVTIYIERGTDPDNPFVIMSKAKKTMVITTDPSVDEGGTFIVSAKDNAENLITDVKVNMLFNGVTTGTTTGTLELTAPAVPESLDYRVEATAEGYTTDDTTIKVINQPKIYIKSVTAVEKDKSFTIKAGGDDGNSYGITITITDSTGAEVFSEVTAGPDGVSGKITKTGTFTIVASKDNYISSDQLEVTVKKPAETPGFELLTLIAAIGVAYILLRRRRK